jgi:3-oxoacyl-[acyl-carrier protein] reductase
VSDPARRIDARVALVTGGSRGIGRAVVERLCHAGLEVCFTYLKDEQAAETLVRNLRADEHRVRAVRADSRDAAALSAVVGGVVAERGRLDVLVNNAGITADRLLTLMSEEEWSNVLETSLSGLFGATKPAARQMMRQRSGRIVNVTSVSGLVGFAGQCNYAAAKSAIIGFTRALAKELAPVGVTVNAIAPGYVETDMLRSLSPAQREAAIERVPMRRFAKAEEVASLVAYVGLEAPSFMTGQTLVIDGGMTA